MNFSCSLMVFWINSVDPRVFFQEGWTKERVERKDWEKKKEEKEKAQLHGTIDSFDFFWLVCVMKKFAAGFFRWFLAGGWQERKGKRKEERCEQVKKEKKKRTKKKKDWAGFWSSMLPLLFTNTTSQSFSIGRPEFHALRVCWGRPRARGLACKIWKRNQKNPFMLYGYTLGCKLVGKKTRKKIWDRDISGLQACKGAVEREHPNLMGDVKC